MKPLKTEIAFTTPWFQVVAKTMKPRQAPFYSLTLPDYSTVLALTAAKRVVLVRQYRPAVEDYTLELPSGIIDPGESPAEAAKRELLEETGYHAAAVEVLGPMNPDLGRLSNQSWGCFAKDVRKAENKVPERGIEVIEWPLEDLYRGIAEGTFSHAIHAAILLQAILKEKVPGPKAP